MLLQQSYTCCGGSLWVDGCVRLADVIVEELQTEQQNTGEYNTGKQTN